MKLIAPSILSADGGRLNEEIAAVEKAGADWIHIDVMDGHFVPNITMGPFIVETCHRISKLPLDVHLMIDNAEDYVESFINAGASNITVHIERDQNILRTLQRIRSLGAHPGVAINPGTAPSSIESVLPFLDMVLVMTVNPGFSGQKFIPEMVEKIAAVKTMINAQNHAIRLEVDGGITGETIPLCFNAGADTYVAATAIFKNTGGIKAGVEELSHFIK